MLLCTRIAKALADDTRLRALASLGGGELCVCQVIALLGLAPSTVSRHMAVLDQAGLVEKRKVGRWAYYRMARKSPEPAVRNALRWVVDSLGSERVIRQDAGKLERIRQKPLQITARCYACA
ncbi:MAG: metalloregulator ArsR/SmtB family transcription factor [Phycisphaera sp.]|nr:metalloregulator ArsR/SmtB family transcription factor [Phycisphaera sp.]